MRIPFGGEIRTVVKPLRVLSLGWGVQSWTLAAMAALGEIEKIDYAIHSDTTFEMGGTYTHAAKWTPWLEERGVRVARVTGDPQPSVIEKGSGAVMVPAFKHTEEGKPVPLRRQCTKEWKIRPIRKFIRTLLDGKLPPDRVRMIMGISWDEFHRMKDSEVGYITFDYPLVDLRMTRSHCIQWLETHSLDVPPKSACTFCPYHTLRHWKQLKSGGGPDWESAVAVDESLRNVKAGNVFVHQYGIPLKEAVIIPEDSGVKQLTLGDSDPTCDSGFCFS